MKRMRSSIIFAFAILTIQCFETHGSSKYNQVQFRVLETVDRFITAPVTAMNLMGTYYHLGSFPKNLRAQDRAAGQAYLFSLVSTLEFSGLKPYYGLEDGLFQGYLHASLNLVPRYVYREPGNSGFTSDDPDLAKYANVCVDRSTGTEIPCKLSTSASTYIKCNNNCALIPCGEHWCKDYEIIDYEESQEDRFFVPRSEYCIDVNGAPSQEPGIIFAESTEGITTNGTCTFGDGTLVQRNVSGAYASCTSGNAVCDLNDTNDAAVCDTVFAGAIDNLNYDPRWRGWYIASREVQVPQFSDPYLFFTFGTVGISYTYPIHTTDTEGRSVFEGVLAVDMELADVSDFLQSSFLGTEFFAAIYEDKEPHKMIGVSTGSEVLAWVLDADTEQNCTPEQRKAVPRICRGVQLTIDDFVQNSNDEILSKAHDEFLNIGYDSNATVIVHEDDEDVATTSYVATSVVYDRTEENLRWRVVVASQLPNNPDDTIQKGEGMFYFLLLIGGLGFLLCFLLFVAFFRRRSEQAVQFADVNFTSAFLLLSALMNLSTFTLLGSVTDESCLLRMWSFYLLSSMMLSPLFVKAYRTYKLLGSSVSSAMSIKMNNLQAFYRTVPIPLIQTGILLIFTFVDPMKAVEVVDVDAANPIKSITCAADTYAFTATQSVFDFTLLSLGCALAYLTRNIDSRFGDAKALLFAMYNIAFDTLMISVVLATVDITESAKSVLIAIGIFWGTVFSSAAFVLPRLINAKKDRRLMKKHLRRMRHNLEMQRQINRVTSHVSSVDYLHESGDALKILICTANLGNAEPTLDSMKTWIPEKGLCSGVKTLNGGDIEAEKFDIIVIGMQEATWSGSKTKKKIANNIKSERDNKKSDMSLDSDMGIDDSYGIGIDDSYRIGTDKNKRQRRHSLIDKWTHHKGTGFRGSANESSLFKIEEENMKEDAYLSAVEGADIVALRRMIRFILGDEYSNAAQEQRGQMRQTVWALKDIIPGITDIKISGTNTGVGNVLWNKGGIGISLKFQDTRLSFLSAHLAAHEGEKFYQARCENITDILKNTKTHPLHQKHDIDMSISSHHMFVLGDLNFRTRFFDKKIVSHEEKFKRAMDLIEAEDWKELYRFDELQRGIENEDILVDFQALPCEFSPTFKVQRSEGFVYTEKRVPSYTDRILFKSSDGLFNNLAPLSHEACTNFSTSDHKPIRMAFSLVPNDMFKAINVTGRYKLVFSEIECSDIMSGAADASNPYVKFVWDSDSVGLKEEGRIKLNFWNQSKFPSTPVKYKTVNPKWPDTSVALLTTQPEIKVDATLYLAVYDYDFMGDHDILGTLPINLSKILQQGEVATGKVLNFEEPLTRWGRPGGRVKFKLEISTLVG